MSGCPQCDAAEEHVMGYSARDYIQFWRCQSCGHSWNRWARDDPRWAWAERWRLSVKAAKAPNSGP